MTVLLIAAAGMYAGCSHASDVSIDNTAALQEFRIDFPSVAEPSGEPTFELAADLPSVDSMMVYRVEHPVITADYVEEIGRRLGFEGSAHLFEATTGTRITMIDEEPEEVRSLVVWVESDWVESGKIEYRINEPDMLYPGYPPSLPSEEEAKRIAFDFLEEAGLLPADYGEFSTVADDIEVGGVGRAGTGTYMYTTHLLLGFPRRIGGFPVIGEFPIHGLGYKLWVRVCDKGEVGTASKSWKQVSPYQEVALKPAGQAYQELATGQGSYYVPWDCEKVVVEEVLLAYWMEREAEPQDYVVPVYEFRGKCLDKDGNYLKEFCGWCVAPQYSSSGSLVPIVDVEADFVMVGFEDQSTIELTKGTSEFEAISAEAIAVFQGIYVAVEMVARPDEMETIKRDSKFVQIRFDQPVKVSISKLVQEEDKDRFLYDEAGYKVVELTSAVFVFTGEDAGLIFDEAADGTWWYVSESKRIFDWLEDMVDYVGRHFEPSST